MALVAEWIIDVVKNHNNADVKQSTRKKVAELCSQFPIYSEMA